MRGFTRTHSVCLRVQERARLLFEATAESTAHTHENSRSLAPDSVPRTIICAINEQMNLRCAFKVNQQAAIHFYPLYPIRVTKGTMLKGIIHTAHWQGHQYMEKGLNSAPKLLPRMCHLLHYGVLEQCKLKLRYQSLPRLIRDNFRRSVHSLIPSPPQGRASIGRDHTAAALAVRRSWQKIPKGLLRWQLNAAWQGSCASIFMAGDTVAPSPLALYCPFLWAHMFSCDLHPSMSLDAP